SASISTYLLPPALSAFRKAYPRTDLVIETGNAAEIARSVVESRLDVGIVSLPVRDRELRVTPFHDDELVAIAPPDDPRAARAPPRRSARRPPRGGRGGAGARAAGALRPRRQRAPGHRRLVPRRRGGPGGAHGAQQYRGHQEAGRGRARPLGHVLVRGAGGG